MSVNSVHIRSVAQKAIDRRLRYPAPEALRAVHRDGDGYIVRVNSGGNAIAVEDAFNRRPGWRAVDAGGNPDGYGCAIRVTRISRTAPED